MATTMIHEETDDDGDTFALERCDDGSLLVTVMDTDDDMRMVQMPANVERDRKVARALDPETYLEIARLRAAAAEVGPDEGPVEPPIDPTMGHYGDPVVMECAGDPGCGQVEHAVCFMCSQCEAHRYPNKPPRSHWMRGTTEAATKGGTPDDGEHPPGWEAKLAADPPSYALDGHLYEDDAPIVRCAACKGIIDDGAVVVADWEKNEFRHDACAPEPPAAPLPEKRWRTLGRVVAIEDGKAFCVFALAGYGLAWALPAERLGPAVSVGYRFHCTVAAPPVERELWADDLAPADFELPPAPAAAAPQGAGPTVEQRHELTVAAMTYARAFDEVSAGPSEETARDALAAFRRLEGAARKYAAPSAPLGGPDPVRCAHPRGPGSCGRLLPCPDHEPTSEGAPAAPASPPHGERPEPCKDCGGSGAVTYETGVVGPEGQREKAQEPCDCPAGTPAYVPKVGARVMVEALDTNAHPNGADDAASRWVGKVGEVVAVSVGNALLPPLVRMDAGHSVYASKVRPTSDEPLRAAMTETERRIANLTSDEPGEGAGA